MLDFNEFFSCFGVFVFVWVIFFGELVVCFLDFCLGRGFSDVEEFVRIFHLFGKVRGRGVEMGLNWGVSCAGRHGITFEQGREWCLMGSLWDWRDEVNVCIRRYLGDCEVGVVEAGRSRDWMCWGRHCVEEKMAERVDSRMAPATDAGRDNMASPAGG
jgi:hypothetical protein